MSLAEAEYVALSASCAQVMWMTTQLKDYGFNYNKIPLYCDSHRHINIMATRTTFAKKAHPYSVSFHKGTEIGLSILSRRIGIEECLTLADLEVLTNETA
ncbi:hypothetical protein Tco_0554118 [Tanacetum coccineum]